MAPSQTASKRNATGSARSDPPPSSFARSLNSIHGGAGNGNSARNNIKRRPRGTAAFNSSVPSCDRVEASGRAAVAAEGTAMPRLPFASAFRPIDPAGASATPGDDAGRPRGSRRNANATVVSPHAAYGVPIAGGGAEAAGRMPHLPFRGVDPSGYADAPPSGRGGQLGRRAASATARDLRRSAAQETGRSAGRRDGEPRRSAGHNGHHAPPADRDRPGPPARKPLAASATSADVVYNKKGHRPPPPPERRKSAAPSNKNKLDRMMNYQIHDTVEAASCATDSSSSSAASASAGSHPPKHPPSASRAREVPNVVKSTSFSPMYSKPVHPASAGAKQGSIGAKTSSVSPIHYKPISMRRQPPPPPPRVSPRPSRQSQFSPPPPRSRGRVTVPSNPQGASTPQSQKALHPLGSAPPPRSRDAIDTPQSQKTLHPLGSAPPPRSRGFVAVPANGEIGTPTETHKTHLYPPPPKGRRQSRRVSSASRSTDVDLAPSRNHQNGSNDGVKRSPGAAAAASSFPTAGRKQRTLARGSAIPLASSSFDSQHSGAADNRDYVIGEKARSSSHMMTEPDPERAEGAADSLSEHDFAFVKRSDGSFTYAVLAFRTSERGADDADDPDGGPPPEETMTFVLGRSGCTKVIPRAQWGGFVRLVSPDVRCRKDHESSVASLAASVHREKKSDRRSDDGNDDGDAKLNREERGRPPSFHSGATPRSQRLAGCREDYTLGDTLRCLSHMVVETSPRRATEAVGSLLKHDFAFVKRSDGLFTYSILAFRSDEESASNPSSQETMTFVLSSSGCTKVLKRSQWGQFVRPVSANDVGEKKDPTTPAAAAAANIPLVRRDARGSGGENDDEQEQAEARSNHEVEDYLNRLRAEFYRTRGGGPPTLDDVVPPDAIAFDEAADDAISCISAQSDLGSECQETARYVPSEPMILEQIDE